MFYLPLGLAPRVPRWPWMSVLMAIGFFAASFWMRPELVRFDHRLAEAQKSIEALSQSRWLIPSGETEKRKAAFRELLRNDPDLSPWLYQVKKKNTQAFWVTPWVIPQYSVIILVCLGLIVLGGFIENRIGSLPFGVVFSTLLYLGYGLEAYWTPSSWGLALGGSMPLYILAAAYLALFALKDFSLWWGEDIRPVISLPSWTVVSLALIGFESFGVGGYAHMNTEIFSGYYHFLILIVSYFAFRFLEALDPLPESYLSFSEVRLVNHLGRQMGSEALQTIKKLLKYNPSNLDPVDVYYRRVIEPLGRDGILTPENQKFLDKYVSLLVAHHFDREDYNRIIQMLKARPKEVLPASFFKLLLPKEWLELARHIDRCGDWIGALNLYATCLDYFFDSKLRTEAVRRAEVLVHRRFGEAIQRHTLRKLVLKEAREFLEDYPKSPVARIVIDHVQHLKNVIKAESSDQSDAA